MSERAKTSNLHRAFNSILAKLTILTFFRDFSLMNENFEKKNYVLNTEYLCFSLPFATLECRLTEVNCSLSSVLEPVRPHVNLTFDNILAHINTIYVLKTKSGVLAGQGYLRLKVSRTVFSTSTRSTERVARGRSVIRVVK